MHKRRFLRAATAVAALPAAHGARAAPASFTDPSPVVLTISGAITRPNRSGFDPATDILMGKHGLAFDRACALDFARIARLPMKRFGVTLEYDGKRHDLAGPLLINVLRLTGADFSDDTMLGLRAVDGYAPQLPVRDARRYAYIVATHRDGRPLALGGLGPLWMVYEADRFPEVAAKPVNERFATCPWGLYHIAVGV